MADGGEQPVTQTGQRGVTRSTLAVSAFFALAPAAAVAGGLFLAPWQAAMALLGAPLRTDNATWRTFALPALAILVFAAYVATTIIWSPVQRWDQAVKVVAVLGAGVLFTAAAAGAAPRGRALIAAAGAASCIVMIVMLGIEAIADMPLNRLDQPDAITTTLARNPGKGIAVLVVLVWGVVAAYGAAPGRMKWLAFGCVAGAAALSTQFDFNANLFAIVGAFGVYLAGLAAPSFVFGLISGGLALWMLAAPWLMPLIINIPGLSQALPDSWQMRLEIWRFALDRIAEKPALGWGLDSARYFHDTLGEAAGFTIRLMPLHPHSAALHVWLETGAVGAFLAAAAIFIAAAVTARALRDQRNALAAAAAGFAALGFIWNVSYGAWQEWFMAVPFALAALIAASVKRA